MSESQITALTFPGVRSLTHRLTVITFFAIVLAPVLLFGYDGPWFGPGDISVRNRAPFPEKFAPGAFKLFDTWFADRVGLRYPLIYVGTNFHIGALHRPLDNHIVFGRDGWMYWTDDRETTPAIMADARGKLRFKAKEIERIDAQLTAAHNQHAACGIASAVLIAPNKQSVYGEFLLNVPSAAPPTRLDVLLAQLNPAARDTIVDPRQIMRAAKLRDAPLRLYNKTETHWNGLGAYYAYAAVMQKLALMLPDHPEPKPLDDFQVIAGPYPGGDMGTRVLFSPWRFFDDDVSLAPKVPVSTTAQLQIDPAHFVYRNPNGKGQLVLFGDSFAGHHLGYFFAQHFAEVHRYVAETFNGPIIAMHKPQAVLFETVERYLDRLLLKPIDLPLACAKQ
jgi:alginate O-acetyltransferase complex protein AlgJ